MQPQDNLDFLAKRVGEGDFQAKAQLRQELEPGLPLIVRRVLERGTAHSSLERKILLAARRLAPPPRPGASDPRAAPVAQNLCRMVIDRLWPGHTEDPWHATLTA